MEERIVAEGLSRRTVLHGLTASAVAAGSLPWAASSASAAPGKHTDPAIDWAAYGRTVGAAFDRMQNVGGAVAVVSADQVLHTSTYGVRGLKDRKPVTRQTVFRVGSTTKSMTAAWSRPTSTTGRWAGTRRSSTPGPGSAPPPTS
jgi:CubicO group peptidase (beta-lactamase class C family)